MTNQPFADQHAIIEAAQKRICATEEQVYAALARIPKPPGAITPDCHDEWRYCERASAYVRDLTMRHWEVAGDGSGGVCAEVTLFVEQTDTGALREWSIYLDGRAVEEMTAQEARRLAATLLDAATALEASQERHDDRHRDDHRGDPDRDDHHLCDRDDHDPADADRDDHDPADADRDDHHPGGDTLEAGRPHTRKPVA